MEFKLNAVFLLLFFFLLSVSASTEKFGQLKSGVGKLIFLLLALWGRWGKKLMSSPLLVKNTFLHFEGHH